jgi:2-deoxy-scyllo-inosamine dehydrogenase (SAM-dependent)
MSPTTLDRVVAELQGIAYAGRVSYHFYNEPLLNRNLAHIVETVALRLPAARQVLFTNGDLLTDERYEKLYRAGIGYFVVTAHSGAPYPERPKQYIQYPAELVLTNRGGVLEGLPGPSSKDLGLACYAPSEMLIVTVTGDVVLCYEDALRTQVFGNICTESLDAIWYSPEFVRIRDMLASGDRSDAASICAQCTNRAHTRTGRSDRSEPFWEGIVD